MVVLSAGVVLAGVATVSLRNLFHAALSLGLVLVGTAGLFLTLEAEFLAWTQLLIYVGAVLTLIVFAIMLTSGMGQGTLASASAHRARSAAVVALFWLVTVGGFSQISWPAASTTSPYTVPVLGQELLTTYLLPFEVISVVLLAAMVGAIVIGLAHVKGRATDPAGLPAAPGAAQAGAPRSGAD